ncbi:hypothetical protein DQ04_01441010 [Trypanosoma grayi]|uniref:hypothetical protein n=1 Tax=Trypanosoma grayi TaxID=71804 RepID=UPI0004F4A4C8|nr:hypothetical protein DQ04_01441010 [Trypanosoma grayi]KEG12755.1 hypothetical protein DQ04_01441010 [Trypanosoma grayi]
MFIRLFPAGHVHHVTSGSCGYSLNPWFAVQLPPSILLNQLGPKCPQRYLLLLNIWTVRVYVMKLASIIFCEPSFQHWAECKEFLQKRW